MTNPISYCMAILDAYEQKHGKPAETIYMTAEMFESLWLPAERLSLGDGKFHFCGAEIKIIPTVQYGA